MQAICLLSHSPLHACHASLLSRRPLCMIVCPTLVCDLPHGDNAYGTDGALHTMCLSKPYVWQQRLSSSVGRLCSA